MGLAARSFVPEEPRVVHLRLLHHPRKPRLQTSSSRASAARDARSTEAFCVACVFMAVLAIFGIGRVMLTAKAAEASIDAARLRGDIKAELFLGDALEAQHSALATPSRIESIAEESLKMAQASKVSYLALPAVAHVSASDDFVDEVPKTPINNVTKGLETDTDPVALVEERTGTIAGIVKSVIELAAGEAHVLLLGDVGLATSR